jgi:hypothetical protein
LFLLRPAIPRFDQLVGAVIERHDFIGAKVRERKFNARYRV